MKDCFAVPGLVCTLENCSILHEDEKKTKCVNDRC